MAKSWKRSKTIWWGHVQNISGMVVVALGAFVPANFPGLPAWVYGLALMASGIITYWLRVLTKDKIK